MDKIFCSFITNSKYPNLLVVKLDSKQEWNTELKGKESCYDEFIDFLSKLIVSLAEQRPIYAAYTERRTKKIIKKLKQNKIDYVVYPVDLVEKIFRVFMSGIYMIARSEKDIKKIIEMKDRPNEWLFFTIGKIDNVDFLRYLPWYLSIERNYGDFKFDVLTKPYSVIYHEIDSVYAEIQSCYLKENELKSILSSLGDKKGFRIQFD